MTSELLEEKTVLVIISKPPLIAYLFTSTPLTEEHLLYFSAEVA
jgi:hypothetical protein